jgi:putative DNA-invertase from lambdoid prophage Rac
LRVAIYSRVSTEEQNVNQQAQKIIEYAKAHDYVISKVIRDTESASLPLHERKRFKKLLLQLHLYDAVLVFNIDRLTRNWEDQAIIEKHFQEECRLISISEPIDLCSAAGRLMFRLKMAVSCYMPEDMREKQQVGIERAKKQGKYKGRKRGSKNKN